MPHKQLTQLVWTVLAAVFLAFGVFLLITAYYQNHPVVFLALFFSSCLIILLSLVVFVGVFFKFRRPSKVDEIALED